MEKNMYFIIADISGYTAFMLKSKVEHTHASLVITKLMSELIKKVQLPLHVAKLEGDAVFLYMEEEEAAKNNTNVSDFLGAKFIEFFDTFTILLHQLGSGALCSCGGCQNIKELNLKMVVHYGTAEIQQIGDFKELAGVDVILIHRLLKNKLKEHRYIILTDPAYKKVTLPPDSKVANRVETDKDLGSIPIHVYYPPGENLRGKEWGRLKRIFNWVIGEIITKLVDSGKVKLGKFNNLPH